MQWNSGTSLRWGAALLATAFTGCGLDLASPVDSATVRTPASWQAAGQGQHGRISEGWVGEFSDRRLERLVDEALAYNRDLKATAARMRAARYDELAGRSRLVPNLDAGGGAGFSLSENGPLLPTSESESYNLTLSAAWEVDLWGRLRDLTAAEAANTAAAEALYRGARLSLAANTAKAWYNLLAADAQVELAEFTLKSFRSNLRISERNYRGTGEGVLDVQFGRTNVAAAERSLQSSRLARNNASRALETLLGRYPSAALEGDNELPELRRGVPSGIPVGLLERRPDLAIARADVYASARRADAARKSLLPSLVLTGSGGTPVSRFANFLDPDWLVASVGASVAQNLFDGGQRANLGRAALERNEATIHDYSETALQAFREVENALDADRSLGEQEAFLLTEVKQAGLAEKQAVSDYSEGIEGADILSVLEAQRRATNARGNLINLRNNRLQNRIDLHLALGGDFRTPEPSK